MIIQYFLSGGPIPLNWRTSLPFVAENENQSLYQTEWDGYVWFVFDNILLMPLCSGHWSYALSAPCIAALLRFL